MFITAMQQLFCSVKSISGDFLIVERIIRERHEVYTKKLLFGNPFMTDYGTNRYQKQPKSILVKKLVSGIPFFGKNGIPGTNFFVET